MASVDLHASTFPMTVRNTFLQLSEDDHPTFTRHRRHAHTVPAERLANVLLEAESEDEAEDEGPPDATPQVEDEAGAVSNGEDDGRHLSIPSMLTRDFLEDPQLESFAIKTWSIRTCDPFEDTPKMSTMHQHFGHAAAHFSMPASQQQCQQQALAWDPPQPSPLEPEEPRPGADHGAAQEPDRDTFDMVPQPQIKVRNTFVHLSDDEDEETFEPSVPTGRRARTQTVPARLLMGALAELDRAAPDSQGSQPCGEALPTLLQQQQQQQQRQQPQQQKQRQRQRQRQKQKQQQQHNGQSGDSTKVPMSMAGPCAVEIAAEAAAAAAAANAAATAATAAAAAVKIARGRSAISPATLPMAPAAVASRGPMYIEQPPNQQEGRACMQGLDDQDKQGQGQEVCPSRLVLKDSTQAEVEQPLKVRMAEKPAAKSSKPRRAVGSTEKASADYRVIPKAPVRSTLVNVSDNEEWEEEDLPDVLRQHNRSKTTLACALACGNDSDEDEAEQRPQGPRPCVAASALGTPAVQVSYPLPAALCMQIPLQPGMVPPFFAAAGYHPMAPFFAQLPAVRAMQHLSVPAAPQQPGPLCESKTACDVSTPSGSSRRHTAERTTVVLQNLPLNYRRPMLLRMLDAEGFAGKYDFVYLPMDFKTRAGFGYAFINLSDPAVIPRFWQAFEGYNKWMFPSAKVCRVSWSVPHQGLKAHLKRYRNSPLMHESVPDEYRPVVFTDGARVPFPPPTKDLVAPNTKALAKAPKSGRRQATT